MHSFLFYSIAFFSIILTCYFAIAGSAYVLFYRFLSPIPHPNQQRRKVHAQNIQRDIQHSMLSAGIFAISAALTMLAQNINLTRLYSQPQAYPLWYLGISYITVLILQDMYFYFTHRLFHQPGVFQWLHQGHHRSHAPTPWTAFAFDPLEAIVQVFFLIAIVFMIPLHFITLIAILTTMSIWAVLNHLGIDRFPKNFPHHWLGHWFIGPAHHSIHHLKYTSHYGLYFTFWDRLFGTQDIQSEQL